MLALINKLIDDGEINGVILFEFKLPDKIGGLLDKGGANITVEGLAQLAEADIQLYITHGTIVFAKEM